MKKSAPNWSDIRMLERDSTLILNMSEKQKITKYIKDYLLDKYNDLAICSNFTIQDLIQYYKNGYNSYLSPEETFIIQKVWERLSKRIFTIDFDNDADFLEFKNKAKEDAKNNRVTLNEEVILTNYYPNRCIPMKTRHSSFAEAIKYIKKQNSGVLVRNIDTLSIWPIASALGYTVVAANKKVVTLLNKQPLKCFITEDTIKNHKLLRAYKAFLDSNFYEYIRNCNSAFIETLPNNLKDLFKLYRRLSEKFAYYGMSSYVRQNVEADEAILKDCNTFIEYFTKFNDLIGPLDIYDKSCSLQSILSYLIMKNKLYKINYTCYKNLKTDKLIKALCGKS